jgi:hypothetical protein
MVSLKASPLNIHSIPCLISGYSADESGNLLLDNELESYEQVVDGMELQSMVNVSEEVEAEGCGKHRCVTNTQYKDFWLH